MSKNLQTRLLNAALLIVVGLAGYGATIYFERDNPPADAIPARYAPKTVEGESLNAVPDFAFTDLQGKKHKLYDFKDKIIILNFWASWCPPCVLEFPALLDLAKKNPQDVIFIGFSSDRTIEPIEKFLQNYQPLPENIFIAQDPDILTVRIFKIAELPQTIITDKALNQRKKLVGIDWDPIAVQKLIDSLK